VVENHLKFKVLILLGWLVLPVFCAAETSPNDLFNIDSGCGASIGAGAKITCEPWQKGSVAAAEGMNVASCVCSNTCLTPPPNHYYYDDPVKKHRQTDENEVTLPTVLAWDHVEAWQKEDGEYTWHWSAFPQGDSKRPTTSKLFGARSYLLEIDNANGELNDSASKGGIFRRILTTNEFNARQDFYPCFYNSDTVIRWRVRPCCKENGEYCQPEEQATWWTFRTSAAPEPVNPDDPDWNGPDGAKNISYNGLKPTWCQATVSKEKQPLNENLPLALSFQLRAYSDENKIVLTGQTIPQTFAQLASWLRKDVPPLPAGRSCHYLQKQADNTCKADVVNPIQAKVVRSFNSYYFWSHKELPNSDRDLFTKNLTYYWQLRRCFNNPNAGEESCNSDSDKHWGQLWQFTAKNDPIDPPTGMAPQNDVSYADSQNAKLTGLPGRLQWQPDTGANSFEYDIQKITGNTSQSIVNNAKRTTASQVFFVKNASEVSGEGEAQGIELELDTAYKWRVKSCFPSLPVGNVCEPTWSSWYYFRTTGRAPKTASMEPKSNAASVMMPVTLQWEAVAGAKSYLLTFDGKKISVTNGQNQYALDYPAIKQSQTYQWSVQTCADANATKCGAPSPQSAFKTAALGASSDPVWPTGATANSQLTYNFSWNPVPGAHYYKFTLNYNQPSTKETNSNCKPGTKVEKTVKESSINISNDISELYCLGKYDWKVLACFDQQCSDAGAAPATWQFDFISGGQEIKKGQTVLAVCGLTNDNPNTPWDDREQCGAKHILLNIMQIINFILFRMSIILLPVLVAATGAMYYTSFGGPDLKQKAISWWKWIGVGYAILFFAWTLVGILLALFGYAGAWWSV